MKVCTNQLLHSQATAATKMNVMTHRGRITAPTQLFKPWYFPVAAVANGRIELR
jgi:hypothetical protein